MDPEGKKPGKVRRKEAGAGDNSANNSYLDGQLLIAEAELLRAIAAALDLPMPPLTS